MKYNELNGHFREVIRERVASRIKSASVGVIDTKARDVFVLCIILLADENDIPKAADRFLEMKQRGGDNSITHELALHYIKQVHKAFPTEVSILSDLYQMQNDEEDILDIIAHMEIRLLED